MNFSPWTDENLRISKRTKTEGKQKETAVDMGRHKLGIYPIIVVITEPELARRPLSRTNVQ